MLIDEGNDVAQIVYPDVDDVITARKLTDRLNNAIYRWMVKNGIQVPTNAQQGQ